MSDELGEAIATIHGLISERNRLSDSLERFKELVEGVERLEEETDDHEVARNKIRLLLERFRAADNGQRAY